MTKVARKYYKDHLHSAGISELATEKLSASLHACAEKVAHISASTGPLLSFFVPGRIEFLGKHADYAGGRSLVCAVERGLCVAAAPRDDRTIRMVDLNRSDPVSFEIDPNLSPTIGHWSNYPMTVARRVARNFGPGLRGADIFSVSDLPPAAGLSSSSALIVAIFLALSEINRLRHRDIYKANIRSEEDLAGYLGTVENGQSFGTLAGDRGVGTFGGSQDHTAILCARPAALCQYSFAPVRFEREVPLPVDHQFVVASSGVVAEKTAAAKEKYNRLSLCVAEIVKLWNRNTGRSDPTLAIAVKSSADAPEKIRALLKSDWPLLERFEQFLEESERIIPAVGDALMRGEIDSVGPLVDRSQRLAETKLGNQVAQTIFLARRARELGAVAASAFGAGFGGSVWAMVPQVRAKGFEGDWRSAYQEAFPRDCTLGAFFTTRAGPGVVRM